jgi:hypothetical protein
VDILAGQSELEGYIDLRPLAVAAAGDMEADAAARISGDTPQFGLDQFAEVFLDPLLGKGVGAGDRPVTVLAARQFERLDPHPETVSGNALFQRCPNVFPKFIH